MSKNITPRWFNQRLEIQRELNRIRAFAMRQVAHILRGEAVGANGVRPAINEKEKA